MAKGDIMTGFRPACFSDDNAHTHTHSRLVPRRIRSCALHTQTSLHRMCDSLPVTKNHSEHSQSTVVMETLQRLKHSNAFLSVVFFIGARPACMGHQNLQDAIYKLHIIHLSTQELLYAYATAQQHWHMAMVQHQHPHPQRS